MSKAQTHEEAGEHVFLYHVNVLMSRKCRCRTTTATKTGVLPSEVLPIIQPKAQSLPGEPLSMDVEIRVTAEIAVLVDDTDIGSKPTCNAAHKAHGEVAWPRIDDVIEQGRHCHDQVL